MEFNLNNKSLEKISEKIEKIENDIDYDKAAKGIEKFSSDAMKTFSDLISEE